MKEISCSTTCSCLTYPVIDEKATKALNKLRSIAFFLNERWHKNTIGTGFFLTPSTQLEYAVEDRKYGWAILKHSNVKYPGVIYFKSKEAAMKALKIAYTEGCASRVNKHTGRHNYTHKKVFFFHAYKSFSRCSSFQFNFVLSVIQSHSR